MVPVNDYKPVEPNDGYDMMCLGCGAIVGDQTQHDVWHRLLDALTAGVVSKTEER